MNTILFQCGHTLLDGLFGQIVEVSAFVSHVLQISDTTHAVPVVVSAGTAGRATGRPESGSTSGAPSSVITPETGA